MSSDVFQHKLKYNKFKFKTRKGSFNSYLDKTTTKNN